jgi:hypothetical protein
VAVRGAVVVHAVWRQDRDQGGGWPTSFQDIACAVGVARAIGPTTAVIPTASSSSVTRWAGGPVPSLR